MIITALVLWEGAGVDPCRIHPGQTTSPSQDTLTLKLCLREAKGIQIITAPKVLSWHLIIQRNIQSDFWEWNLLLQQTVKPSNLHLWTLPWLPHNALTCHRCPLAVDNSLRVLTLLLILCAPCWINVGIFVLKSVATSLTRACHLLDDYIITRLPISDAELLRWTLLSAALWKVKRSLL